MTHRLRFLRFNGVGALGIVVQLTTVYGLVRWAGINVTAATAVGVVAAVIHNFVWHRRWTWADRGTDERSAGTDLFRFALANGLVSLVGNVAVVSLLTTSTPASTVLANAAGIGLCGLANYWISDRMVFVD